MSRSPSIGARGFIVAMALMGLICVVYAFADWQSGDSVKFVCYLIAGLLASSLKVGLPGIEATLSANFLFTLIGILELSLPETLAIGIASTLAQFYWRPARRLKLIQVVFNLSQVMVSSTLAYSTYQLVVIHARHATAPLGLSVAAITYFGCNTLAMSTIIGLTEEKAIPRVFGESHLWLFPYYMVGAAVAGLVHFLNGRIGWQSSLLILPPIYLMYRSYRLYPEKLETEKKHAEQVSSLHLRTIEALALAIEAKDQTTGEHLQRVRVYSMALAKDLRLSDDETEALRAASMLHDIGKLAVPEHIISKPGRLTPDEFEKMKIHPIVGAEILERVHFPYPVVPIVRAHHEKWDGSGYPFGLAGEAIPIGARILSAVDCFDALASDRQYRKALPIDEAMARVVADAGKSFDPHVVEILQRRYIALEKLATAQPVEVLTKLSTDIKVQRGSAPDAGFATALEAPAKPRTGDENSKELVSSARRAGTEISDIGRAVPLSREDIFSLLAVRLRRLVPHDAMVVYCPKEDGLIAEFASGENVGLFSTLKIPLGEGLSGWVAQNHKSILNGNPSVEPGYRNDPTRYSTLGSALAVPIEGASRLAAVLAVYRAGQDAFTVEDLGTLEVIGVEIGRAVENAAKPKASGAQAGV
jgi:putative nucleotidyltransferase with HDIG domain